ncbi:MAG: protease 4 [Methanoregula sp. PtaU1.Bin051]|nr:MAG: protease 4 [Methanoregula sp. PtaU1.Bin051]
MPDGAQSMTARGGTSTLKWLFFILLVIILLLGAFIAVAYLAGSPDIGISVVRMDGTLVTGDISGVGYAASEQVGRELREAADDPMVEAIVLRVNSPGGTPAAAQEIIGDLEYAKTKKPVVVSMGDMATSAAYYVSSHADRIYANPDTFTAGIGVTWSFPDISRWMEREGYNISVIKSGIRKDMGSSARPITTEERDYAQEIVDASFEEFISDVLSQRQIARSDIEDGRVIRGADAIKINIVDELGNLNDAIAGAKNLANTRQFP